MVTGAIRGDVTDHSQVSEKEPESTVLTVTEDPSGVSETQEMKFIVALPGTELSKRNTGLCSL